VLKNTPHKSVVAHWFPGISDFADQKLRWILIKDTFEEVDARKQYLSILFLI